MPASGSECVASRQWLSPGVRQGRLWRGEQRQAQALTMATARQRGLAKKTPVCHAGWDIAGPACYGLGAPSWSHCGDERRPCGKPVGVMGLTLAISASNN